MKRILLSLLTIVAVVTLATNVTRAWFTDQEVLGTNTLSSAKLDIELRGEYKDGIKILLDTAQTFRGGLAPGVEFGPYAVAVYNKGWGQSTLPVKYAWSQDFLSGDQDLYNMLNVKVREGNCDWIDDSWFDGQGYLYQGKLSAMPDYITSQNPLNPNITRCTWFYFELDQTANNTYQGKQSVFNLTLDATQVENTGWVE